MRQPKNTASQDSTSSTPAILRKKAVDRIRRRRRGQIRRLPESTKGPLRNERDQGFLIPTQLED
jgi:hypothetical protein